MFFAPMTSLVSLDEARLGEEATMQRPHRSPVEFTQPELDIPGGRARGHREGRQTHCSARSLLTFLFRS